MTRAMCASDAMCARNATANAARRARRAGGAAGPERPRSALRHLKIQRNQNRIRQHPRWNILESENAAPLSSASARSVEGGPIPDRTAKQRCTRSRARTRLRLSDRSTNAGRSSRASRSTTQGLTSVKPSEAEPHAPPPPGRAPHAVTSTGHKPYAQRSTASRAGNRTGQRSRTHMYRTEREPRRQPRECLRCAATTAHIADATGDDPGIVRAQAHDTYTLTRTSYNPALVAPARRAPRQHRRGHSPAHALTQTHARFSCT